MAAVLRPPFYAPRPAEVQPWTGSPLASAVIGLLTAVHIFGAGGQAPTKFWRYDYVPEPDWTAKLWLASPDILFTPPGGKPVVPPQRLWDTDPPPPWMPTTYRNLNTALVVPGNPFIPPEWRQDYVDPPVWTWSAPPSNSVRLPITTTFYGAQGQVPTKLWRWDYEPDKVWNGKPFSNVTRFILSAVKPIIAPFWTPRYQLDAPLWSWQIPPDLTIRLPAAVSFFGAPGQAPTKFWHYDYDQSPGLWIKGPSPALSLNFPSPPFIQPPPGNLDQLDKGVGFTSFMVYLGPTLGWVKEFINPILEITTGGSVTLGVGTSVVLCAAPLPVTINLPDIVAWMQEPHYQPYNAYSRSIWIKDFGGNSASQPITIDAFGTQTIDGQLTKVLNINNGIVRLYPLNDLTGWLVG